MKASVVFVTVLVSFMLLTAFCKEENAKNKRDDDVEESKENFLLKRKLHKLKILSRKAAKRLANLNDYSTFYSTYLKPLLRVRVPGTIGHHAVKEFITKTLKDLGWTVELDEFESETPIGTKKFTNIIATLYPQAERRLALAAHYDSKLLTPENGKYFIAATDSAVPCAMLLDFAKLLKMQSDKREKIKNDVTPMLLFLDGEEAFVQWTKNDSIYGARHLSDKLAQDPHHKRSLADNSVTALDALDAFVLFDLIGAQNPQFLDLYPATSYLYQSLQRIESKLHKSGVIDNQTPYFPGAPNRPLFVEDDHIPFLEKGVPILHLISIPFPSVWHTLQDDESALDQASIEHLLKIFRQFVLEYFHLES